MFANQISAVPTYLWIFFFLSSPLSNLRTQFFLFRSCLWLFIGHFNCFSMSACARCIFTSHFVYSQDRNVFLFDSFFQRTKWKVSRLWGEICWDYRKCNRLNLHTLSWILVVFQWTFLGPWTKVVLVYVSAHVFLTLSKELIIIINNNINNKNIFYL